VARLVSVLKLCRGGDWSPVCHEISIFCRMCLFFQVFNAPTPDRSADGSLFLSKSQFDFLGPAGLMFSWAYQNSTALGR